MDPWTIAGDPPSWLELAERNIDDIRKSAGDLKPPGRQIEDGGEDGEGRLILMLDRGEFVSMEPGEAPIEAIRRLLERAYERDRLVAKKKRRRGSSGPSR